MKVEIASLKEPKSGLTKEKINRIHRQIELSPYVIDDITINVGVEPPTPDNLASLTEQNINDISNLLKNAVSTSLSMNGTEITDLDLDDRISVLRNRVPRQTRYRK